MKKSVLIVYYGMIMGGSTTSLLALLSNLDPEKYAVDLQLQSHTGPLLDQIPEHVHLLPPANLYTGIIGKIVKALKGVFTGALVKAWRVNRKQGKPGLSEQVLADFYARHLSRKVPGEYDIAIGYLESWPARQVAYNVTAKKKLCWLHSTFSKLAPVPELEKPWMDQVDKIVFVADDCRDAFNAEMPEYAAKAVTVHNIIDSDLIRKRAEKTDETDEACFRFRDADCFKLVTVCRINISVKGLDRTVECAKWLKSLGKKFQWIIIGDGEDMPALREMIAHADVADCVIPVGGRMNPLPFVKTADVFCMLSRYEGKPMVITESMILGTPPLVTCYLSAAEQIRNGIEGIIVENGEDTAFSAILNCMDSPEILEGMRQVLLQNEYGNREYIRYIEQEYLN